MKCTSPNPCLFRKGWAKPIFLKRRKFYESINNVIERENKKGNEVILMPCGKCKACRLNHADMWAGRLVAEMSYHKFAYFLTLTYSPDFVPIVSVSGNNQLTLCKDDLTLFWKRLRKRLGKVKYFVCGEYGGKTHRPHYHAIVYDLFVPDLVDSDIENSKSNSVGDKYYTSEILDSIWGKGNVIIGKVSYASCGYVAQYVLKKSVNPDYDYGYRVPEFICMSQGIGKQYLIDNVDDIYRHGYYVIKDDLGSPKKLPIPRYFDKLAVDLGVDLDSVKEARIKSGQLELSDSLAFYDYDYKKMYNNRKLVVDDRLKSKYELRKKV